MNSKGPTSPPLNNWLLIDSGGLGSLYSVLTHWWVHQPPLHDSEPMVTQMTLVKLSGPWNKTKRHEYQKGSCTEEEKLRGKGRKRLLGCEGNLDALYTSMKWLRSMYNNNINNKRLVCVYHTKPLWPLGRTKPKNLPFWVTIHRQEITRA